MNKCLIASFILTCPNFITSVIDNLKYLCYSNFYTHNDSVVINLVTNNGKGAKGRSNIGMLMGQLHWEAKAVCSPGRVLSFFPSVLLWLSANG